ncbi:hypothetical protein [Dactylosporangium sp. NPDC005555]|uniref:hypothetical protein n=1 Tax=Dactylosporangium sp. NPDC005555 TaxID=3154889 RepID=UPI0033ADC37F
MQPGTSTEPGTAAVGTRVVDPAGVQVGTVSAVQVAGTDVRPDTIVGIAEHLMGTGYIRIDGTGFLSNDVYAAGNQIAAVSPDVVELRVHPDELYRAAS